MSGSKSSWQVIGQTVKGSRKAVNQDRCGWEAFSDGSEIALAVADGHGSSAHPRSDIGAELAVAVFLETAARFRGTAGPPSLLKQVKLRAEEDFPRNVVRGWQQLVEDHIHTNPAAGNESEGTAAALYGTTLAGALLTDTLVLGWQLGDGDLCFIDTDGAITAPLRQAGQDLGDETDSLCSSSAQLLMRTYWAPRSPGRAPVLVALSTDGLSKSFISFDSYLEFLTGIHGLLRKDGAAKVSEAVPGWLEKASSFSGDDTTLLLAWREHDQPAEG